jgi:hypothetical protein
MTINLLKSLLHNVGVVIVSLALAYLGRSVDSFLGFRRFSSLLTEVFGVLKCAHPNAYDLRMAATILEEETTDKVEGGRPVK